MGNLICLTSAHLIQLQTKILIFLAPHVWVLCPNSPFGGKRGQVEFSLTRKAINNRCAFSKKICIVVNYNVTCRFDCVKWLLLLFDSMLYLTRVFTNNYFVQVYTRIPGTRHSGIQIKCIRGFLFFFKFFCGNCRSPLSGLLNFYHWPRCT